MDLVFIDGDGGDSQGTWSSLMMMVMEFGMKENRELSWMLEPSMSGAGYC